MGSFFGHVLPGSFFIFFAIWWTIQAFRRYFDSLRKNGIPYVSTPTWKVCMGRFGRIDIEAKLLVLMCALGIVIEVVASPIFHHGGIGANNAQHATMYFFFGLVGLLSLILPRIRIFPNHDSIVYATLMLAYVVEALLFKFHLYGRDTLDVLLHTLLLYTIYGCVLCTLAEMRFRHNVLVTLSRAYFTFVQGTWFWHGGWILYNPFNDPWGSNEHGHEHTEEEHGHMAMGMGNHTRHMGEEEIHDRTKRGMTDAHKQLMMAVMAYTWHMAAILIIMLVIGIMIGCCYRKKGDLDEGKFLMHGMNPRDKGYTVISLAEGEDGEGEGDVD